MRHILRIGIIWIVVSVILCLLIAVVPIPSPVNSSQAKGEHQTVYMLFYVGAPVFAFVWVLFGYCLVVFRRHEDVDRPAPPDSPPLILLWAAISFVLVLFLAGWGTFTLHEITDRPEPVVAATTSHAHGQPTQATVAKPAALLPVQVIGQQWVWTFRYPTYGGMESRELVVPINTPIELNITSLDVVHSFWIYDYDIKEDAVPGVSNTAYMLARTTGSPTSDGHNLVTCNELCGLWHGYMRARLHVDSQPAFLSWAKRQYAAEKSSGLLKILPKYSSTYFPDSNSNWPSPPQDQSP